MEGIKGRRGEGEERRGKGGEEREVKRGKGEILGENKKMASSSLRLYPAATHHQRGQQWLSPTAPRASRGV